MDVGAFPRVDDFARTLWHHFSPCGHACLSSVIKLKFAFLPIFPTLHPGPHLRLLASITLVLSTEPTNILYGAMIQDSVKINCPVSSPRRLSSLAAAASAHICIR